MIEMREEFEDVNHWRCLLREDYANPDPEVHERYYDIETQAAWEGYQQAAERYRGK